MEHLIAEVRALRETVDAARSESAAQHREIADQIAVVGNTLAVIDQRLANLALRRTAVPGLTVVGVAAVARAAMLGA